MGERNEQTVIPVIIVGAGPVGLALSLELSRYGVAHQVLTEGARTSEHPKCNTTNARSMEHFRRLGLAREIRFGGLPADYPTDIVYLTRLGEPEIARVRFPTPQQSADLSEPYRGAWQTPEPQHRISQIYLEQILLEHARRRPEAAIAFEQRVTGFEDLGDHVEVEVVGVGSELTRRLSCGWLVGCDGGRSTVRRLAGIPFEGERQARREIFGGAMVATYFRSAELSDLLNGRRGFMYWTLNPQIRSVTVAINGDDLFLTHVQAPDGVGPETLDPRIFIPQVVGRPVGFEVLSSAIWTAGHRLVAKQMSAGRIFLAGDAAHLFTPTGGFGMNTGLDDVANLAWKLAATAQGWGGPDLLASYDAERRPIAHRNTAAASEIADVINGALVPSDIEDTGPSGRAARRAVADIVCAVAAEEFGTVGVQLGVRYDGSPVVAADGSPPTPDLRTIYEPTARPGSRLPHFLLHGAPIFDQLGPGLTLLDGAGDPLAASGLLAVARRRGAPLEHLPLPAGLAREALGALYVLVRPDQHVAWRGDVLPANIDGMLDRTLGFDAGADHSRADGQ